MIVAFPYAYDGPVPEAARRQALAFIEAARRYHPQATLCQMTDERTPALNGVDIARSRRETFGQWYFEAMATFPAEQFLRVDTDIVMRGDPWPVFDADFDIAIAKETKGMMNNGVVFVKNRRFFTEALKDYEECTSQDGWNDIQVATQLTIDSGAFRVRKISPRYNYIPSHEGDTPSDAVMLHYTDGKKDWMLRYLAGRLAA